MLTEYFNKKFHSGSDNGHSLPLVQMTPWLINSQPLTIDKKRADRFIKHGPGLTNTDTSCFIVQGNIIQHNLNPPTTTHTHLTFTTPINSFDTNLSVKALRNNVRTHTHTYTLSNLHHEQPHTLTPFLNLPHEQPHTLTPFQTYLMSNHTYTHLHPFKLTSWATTHTLTHTYTLSNFHCFIVCVLCYRGALRDDLSECA